MVYASIAKNPAEFFSADPSNSQHPSTQGRILLVDDILDNRVVLTRRLTRRGFEVIEAKSGEEALALHASTPFDLVLLDVMMPGISGLEVLTQIRRTFTSQQLPIIMVTANSMS